MILFENAGLIGLGLIGGSLARAMKKHGLAKNIIGYTKSPESSGRALELEIIDEIADSIIQLSAKCDIIIISTPLSSYDSIAREISKSVKENCIITDVGSLKVPFIEIFSEYLPKKNLPFLVPAHPIAGTEKTGVESGYAELFEGKKTILTPTLLTSPDAISKVSNLWHKCGSTTQIIEAGRHDKIYAEVSHRPQFLAFCYAEFIKNNFNNKDFSHLGDDEDFWRWSRICASDPVIWLDIFMMNKNNLLQAVDNFVDNFKILTANAEKTTDNNFNELYHILPSLISEALIKCSPNADEFAGSGFKDFTSYHNPNKEILLNMTEEFFNIIEILTYLIRDGRREKTLELLQQSSGWYNGMRAQRGNAVYLP